MAFWKRVTQWSPRAYTGRLPSDYERPGKTEQSRGKRVDYISHKAVSKLMNKSEIEKMVLRMVNDPVYEAEVLATYTPEQLESMGITLD